MFRRCAFLCSGGGSAVACKVKASTHRNPNFKALTPSDVDVFHSILGGGSTNNNNVITEKDRLEPFVTDWFSIYHAESTSVCLLPTTTEQVSACLRYCNEQSIAVVPQGGNTGFVGGSVPVFDEVVVSLKKMNKVIEVDETSGTLRCEAGCVLETLDDALASHGYMMPVDLGAKGSCTIGGNLATNAGGLRYMRYGSLRGNTLGCKAVLASGEIVDLMSTLKKDNTGYDLKQLFIGSEGTLGIITEVAVALPVKPNAVQTMFLAVRDYSSVCKTFLRARSCLGEILSAMEVIDGDALRLCLSITKDDAPMDPNEAFYMLIETNGSDAAHDQEKLMRFLDGALGEGLVVDGALAADARQSKQMWKMREACATAPNALTGAYIRWFDISLPVPRMFDPVNLVKNKLLEEETKHNNKINNKKNQVIAFGHLGDGNLHLNVIMRDGYDEETCALVDRTVYGHAKQNGYSVSAEHGIGLQKKPYLGYSKPAEAIAIMKSIKGLLDPKGVMNPYKVL
eukprot:PhM_4_TR11566/c0_g1_i1/m.85576/K18204/D2HGDH; D-2-hydroxyglutarate dehydrogenase